MITEPTQPNVKIPSHSSLLDLIPSHSSLLDLIPSHSSLLDLVPSHSSLLDLIASHSSLLDLVLTTRPHHYMSSCVFLIDLSDHCLVGFIRGCRMKRSGPQYVYKRSFKNFDVQAFLHDLIFCNLSSVDLIPNAEIALQCFLFGFNF